MLTTRFHETRYNCRNTILIIINATNQHGKHLISPDLVSKNNPC